MSRFNKIAERVAKKVVAEEAPGFNMALKDFMDYCQNMLSDYMAKTFPNNPVETLEMMMGGRWVRIVKTSGSSSRSAWAFVDRTNGDVMKPAGWSAPAKHARANIFDKATWKNVGPYGPVYLRG